MLVDDEKLKKVVEYVNSSPDYSFERFIKEHDLEKDSVKRAFDTVVRCPFHIDYSPSCSMNDNIHVFNCFSCGRSGSYIKFRSMYSTEVEGNKIGYYQEADQLLHADAAMQAALGFSSIWKKTEILDLGRKRERFHVERGEVLPTGYLELSSILLQHNADEKTIVLFILLMQQGMSPGDIYCELFGKQHKKQEQDTRKQIYDLANLFGKEE